MRYIRRRTDGTHSKLSQVALQIDPGSIDVHTLGIIGCDRIARNIRTGEPMFLEFKDPDQPASKRNRSANEAAMRERFPRHWRMCLTEDDVRRALGLLPPGPV